MTNFNRIIDFHRAFEVGVGTKAELPSKQVIDLRKSLIDEEKDELYEAIDHNDILNVAKEAADLLVVVYGTCVAFGIDADAVFEAVHKSNMSKLTKDGEVIRRADGKILKSDQYQPPNLTLDQISIDKSTS